MTVDTGSDPNICAACIGDSEFAEWVRQNGVPGQCEIEPNHGSDNATVTASVLAERTDEWFREHYTQGSSEPTFVGDSDNVSYEQRGEPYASIMMDALVCDEEVVEAIDPHLPDVSHRDIAQGDEAFYDSTQNYEAFDEIHKRQDQEQEEYWYENRFRYQWQEFCHKVQYERRFFQLKELLDDLFGIPSEYEKGKVRPLDTLPVGQAVFRARLLGESFTEAALSSDPAMQLGAPPRDRTRAGRMNVEFIPAFYAAFSEETAVAEIRPGIGERLAVGKFVVQRELKVFDFTAFSRAAPDQRGETFGHTRYDFIDQMEDEISKPILPIYKQREYIPTQIVAEYLRDYFNCDAVIYRSSMISDVNAESRNIVFLNKGQPFVGNGALLRFESRSVRNVIDVAYTLGDVPF